MYIDDLYVLAIDDYVIGYSNDPMKFTEQANFKPSRVEEILAKNLKVGNEAGCEFDSVKVPGGTEFYGDYIEVKKARLSRKLKQHPRCVAFH